MASIKLTASLEDYIEVVYRRLTENDSVKAIEISKELGVSRASVTEALKKLEKEGLIHYGHYDSIAITDLGEEKALEVIKKHKMLNEFFFDILKLSQEEAADNACKIEHVISDSAFERIQNMTKIAKQDECFLKKLHSTFDN